jgi:UDP-N-acetylglucosamine acyltransferase
MTAIISKTAKVASTAKIGHYCIIEDNCVIGENVVLHSHVVVSKNTTIGDGTEVFPFASIGSAPQDLKYSGEEVYTIIGKNNKIREYVTINAGTIQGVGKTIVGDNCLLMIGVHVAHDCVLGDGIIMANNATLAGHVEVGNGAVIGGLAAVHQFVRIGHNAMIGGLSGVERDVIPFGLVMGERAGLSGLNLVGLKRSNHSKEAINELRHFYNDVFETSGNLEEKLAKVQASSPLVEAILKFATTDSKRNLTMPK